AIKRGVFATRSPHRPNPIGLTVVRLLSIAKLSLSIEECDLLDGTPILDIKPYIPDYDSLPDSRSGWHSELVRALSKERFNVKLSTQAKKQAEWLNDNFKIDFISRAIDLLSTDPSINKTRRIKKSSNGRYCLACGPWR